MILNRCILGVVCQKFDTEKKEFVSQTFTPAGVSPVWYTDSKGRSTIPLPHCPIMQLELDIELVQPMEAGEHVFNADTGRCIRCNCDQDDAYIGGESCIEETNVHHIAPK